MSNTWPFTYKYVELEKGMVFETCSKADFPTHKHPTDALSSPEAIFQSDICNPTVPVRSTGFEEWVVSSLHLLDLLRVSRVLGVAVEANDARVVLGQLGQGGAVREARGHHLAQLVAGRR